MPPVHAANLVANSGNTGYGVDVIVPFKDGKLFLITLSSAMPADKQSTESTRPSTSLMLTM